MSESTWIIGYGNPGRRDDGCGWHVAEDLRSRLGGRDDVRILSLHQLDPLLAEELGTARDVVFVDASVEEIPNGTEWRRILPRLDPPLMTHHLTPSSLLGLVACIWGRCPDAWLVSVRGRDFGFGEGLSPEAEERVVRASRGVASYVLGGLQEIR